MLPACRLELMISSLSSIEFNFQLPVDFRFNVLFPHNISVLYQNSMEISWFSLTMHASPFTKDLAQIPACLCCSSRFGAGAHVHSQKKIKDTQTKLEACEVFAFRCVLT